MLNKKKKIIIGIKNNRIILLVDDLYKCILFKVVFYNLKIIMI